MLLMNNKGFQRSLFTPVATEMYAAGLVEGRACIYEGWTQTQKHLHRLMSPNTCKVYITVLRVLKKKEKEEEEETKRALKILFQLNC